MDAAAPEAVACVVGLGNPGRSYRLTRHNLGFMVVYALVERWRAEGPRQAFGGELWEARFGSWRVRLLTPMAFMNRSGQAVQELVRFFRLPPERLLVVLDDMALPPGRIRLRGGGSAGGHHGLADVLEKLGGAEVPRLRVGIGAAPGPMDAVDYVLGKMSEEELALARTAIDQACQAVEDWLMLGMDAAMTRHNRPANES